MSTKETRRADTVAPEQLLVIFSRGRMPLWMIIAVLIHVALIGGTSLGYIRDTWIDPEAARVRKQAALDKKAQEERDRKKGGASSTNDTASATGQVANASQPVKPPAPATTNAGEEKLPDGTTEASRTNSAYFKNLNKAASSNEIPTTPTMGISVEDTNVR